MSGFVGRSNLLIASGNQMVNHPGLALPHLFEQFITRQVVGVLVPTAVTKRYYPSESYVSQNTGPFSGV